MLIDYFARTNRPDWTIRSTRTILPILVQRVVVHTLI